MTDYRGDDICALAIRNGEEARSRHDCNPQYRTHKTTDCLVQDQINGAPVRGGHLSYLFYFEQNGTVLLVAPLTKRTNHVKRSSHAKRKPFGWHARIANAIGVSCVGVGNLDLQPTTKQLDEFHDLVPALA